MANARKGILWASSRMGLRGSRVSLARSATRTIALKFNFRRLKLHRAIVMLNAAPPPPTPRPEGRVTPLCGLYWGLPLDRIRFLVSVPKHGM